MTKPKKTAITATQQLTLFVQKAKQMQQRECFRFVSRYQSSFTINYKEGVEAYISNLEKPEAETYRSYLIDFRHFMANESPVHVNRILNICKNRARHIAFREELIKLQSEWKESRGLLPDTQRDTPEGQVLVHTGTDLFLTWLNGTIFHPDVEAEALFASFGILKDIWEVKFAKYVGFCSNFIVHMAGVIDGGLNNNLFDLLNDFTPHIRADVVATVSTNESKAAAIRFWKSTRQFAQELCICNDHDQDPVIVVDGYNDGVSDLRNVTVELKGCCRKAVDNAARAITETLNMMDYYEKHGFPPERFIQIQELEVLDKEDVRSVKVALDDYKRSWRKKVGHLRCSIHGMPPGARGIGVDMYHQGRIKNSENSNSVYMQGCCVLFMEEVLKALR